MPTQFDAMAQYLPLPNGQYFEIREGSTPEQALAEAVSKHPAAFGLGEQKSKEDTKGFKAAAAAGLERLKGETALTAGKLGLMDTAEAERYQKAREEAAKARFTPTEEGWTESPWQKLKETAGGSLPYMVAPAAAGLAALAAPVSAPVAAAIGAGAAGLASTGQFTGTNLARQMETGKTLEQTSLGSAVGAAIPQALLDTAAMALMPGVGKLFGSVGEKLTVEQAKAIASQTLGQAARDYAAKTGMAMGREGFTETAQQVMERLQAGLSISDPEARKEYIDSFIGGAALAGIGAPIGRGFERSAAKGQAAQAERDEQAKAAAEAEAAKNQPDALRQLSADYLAAQQQLTALNAQTNAAKPKKGATDEQKAAYDELKAQRADFVNSTFKPLKQEYDQRKGAIEQLLAADQSAIEVAGAEGQQAAKLPLPSDIGTQTYGTEEQFYAKPFQLTGTARLMNEYDNLRNQVAALEQQLAAGPDLATQTQLTEQRAQMLTRMGEMQPIITERGGVVETEKDFNKALAAAEKERLRLLEIGDFDAAAQQAAKVQDLQNRAPFFQELNDFRQKVGQTRDLFVEAPAGPATAVDEQLKQQTLEEESARGLYGPESKKESAKQAFGEAGTGPRGQLELAPAAAEPKAQTGIKPKQLELLGAAEEKVAAAQAALDDAVKTKDTPAIYAATDALNKAKSETALAQGEVGRGMFRPAVLDIFSPSNIVNTAIQNGDTKLINDLATHADSTALNAALDEKLSEREKLINVLENRAGLGGSEKATKTGEPLKSVKRERANLFEQQYEPKQQALFKNGTYPDKELQALYDKGGPAAVEYKNVMDAIEELSKKVTTKQGNAKKSLYEQLVDLAAQHEALKAQLESGIATPTMREKTASLQAKMGKGEAPAPRQMDAKEIHDLKRRIEGVVNKYKLVEGQITPIRDEILKLHDSLYVTTPLEKVSVVAEKKAKEADAAARTQAKAVQAGEARVPKSRGAATAGRINAGNVRKEAETSQKMRDLARDLGMEEEEYQKFADAQTKRFAKLKEKYGKNDPAVVNFQRNMAEELTAKAMEIGKTTPEYKATLAEQIAYFQQTLANVIPVAGAQKAPSQRTGQVTRKQSAAPSRLVSSSPESKAASAREQEAYSKYRGSMADIRDALASEKEGREEDRFLRGVETESVELDNTTVSLLKQNDVRSALTRVGNDPRVDDFSRTIAKLLKTFLDKTNVKLVDKLDDGKGNEVLGAATSKLIELNTNGGLSVETLLHEGTHAAAERIVQLAETNPDLLTREQKLAINELKAIHAKIKNDPGITSKNAKGSLSEFVAEVMSNRNLQKQLAQRKWRMSDMWKGIKSVIMRMLGVQNVETMFGASAVAIEQLFVPSSVRNLGGKAAPETRVTRSLSAKDIAALHDGSNSMKQFADQFGNLIKQKDRTPEDVERIAQRVIDDMLESVSPLPRNTGAPRLKSEAEKLRAEHDAKSVVALPTADTLDYKAMATMSDGKLYDENNPLHFVEAEPATFAALRAMEDPDLRRREAEAIASQRKIDFISLVEYVSGNYENYTTAETALVLKAAAKYGVISDRSGKLKLVEIGKDNRHNIAVVGKEGVDAIIEQLRAGKNLKQAFLDGLQKNADANAKTNERKSGWKKFDQSDNEQSAIDLNAGCAGTPWCTGASVGTARSQIERGDFYVYYNNGRPEVAVRMDGKDSIGEVRGNNPNQALDRNQQQLAESFLRSKGFSNADKYVDEFARKERLIRIAKGTEKVSVEDLLNADDSFINSKGEPASSYSIERALSFRTIDGYGNRPDPTKAVSDFFVQKYLEAAVEAYENEQFVFSEVTLRPDDNAPIEIEFAGKTYKTTNDTLKAAKAVSVSVYTRRGNQEVVAPKLEYTNRINLFRGVGTFPALRSVPEITFFRGGEFGESVANLPADAKVGTVAGYDTAAHGILNGPRVVNRVILRNNDKGLFIDMPDTQFVAVDEGGAGVADNFGYEAAKPLGDRLEKDGWSFSDLRKFYRGDAPAADADSMRSVIEQPLREFFTAIREDFGAAAYDKMMENTDIQRAYDSLNYEKAVRGAIEQVLENEGYTPEAFDKMANLINYTTGAKVSYPKAELIAPNRRGDTPKSAEYEEEPEQRLFAPKDVGVQKDKNGVFSFARKPVRTTSVVAQEPGIVDKMLGNIMGLAGRVQFIDQYAALSDVMKKGLSAGQISSLEATNANYLLRFGQQRSQFAGQFLTNGPVQAVHTKKDGGVETVYRSTKGTSMIDVATALNKAKLADDVEQENMFTLYLAGKRASQVGWDKLNFSKPAQAKAEYEAVMARLNSSPEAKKAFEEAAALYQKYNAGLLDFLVQTGALSAKKAAELKAISYVPFYRINGNGEVQLMIDKEHPVRIANIKDQPQLKELVGGNTAILPVFTSAAQNTFMITGMGLRNQAVKETSFMLQKLGVASAVRQGKGPQGDNVVRFQKNGEDYYALLDTDAYGIPAELIVRGMEGIKTTLPAVIKAMGIPANILRSFVVRNPTYALRQVIRDPLNAWLTTGTDATPVLSSMKELASMVAGRSEAERKLMETGAISSNVYSGDERDMAKFLKDMAAGKSGWDKALAKLDAFALQGDAATRAVIYKDSLAKGMTEQEALLRTLESMNFSRRGVSPSMQALSVMIPFFNAQIQGLDVLYRAFKGDMPYSEQLEIRKKLVQRGLLMAGATIAYAAMMEDDEAYKRAKPEERYGNWFVYVPGVAEPVRVPIPFELGFLFKALPEAVWNMAMQDTKSEYAAKGLGKLAMQTVPLTLPQAVKPVTEAILGKSFYSGDIESTREKDVLATERYRDSTTELAKTIGAVTGKAGVSPIMLDYLLRGYTGGLGVALVQLANPILAPDAKEVAQPSTKASKVPFIGGLFQPVEGRGTLDEAYDRMNEIRQIKGAYNNLIEKGQKAEAKAFAQEYSDKLASMSLSGSVQKRLGELAKVERQIKASPNMSTEEKDAKLAQIDKAKLAMARQFLAVSDRTTPR